MNPDMKAESPKLLGPFRFKTDIIDRFVKHSAGVYLLARSDMPADSALFIGRSRENLRHTLHSHLPENEAYRELKRKNPDRFYFLHLGPDRTLYQYECYIYHRYEPELNKYHPAPDAHSWSCPVCETK
ncbi:hypothetical protein ACFLT7_04755 [candidate division KSB1 bacterium]